MGFVFLRGTTPPYEEVQGYSYTTISPHINPNLVVNYCLMESAVCRRLCAGSVEPDPYACYDDCMYGYGC